MPPCKTTTITLPTFKDVLSRYEPLVPPKLQPLDTIRYDTIPGAVGQRPDKTIEPVEVVKLVEWKLKHGTFRPKLLQLVQSNGDEEISKITRRAFTHASVDASEPAPLLTLKLLAELKGIGPATASLLLSVRRPDTIPFFSDELFRWCVWDDVGSPKGWQRKIKYNLKEYEMLIERFAGLRKRLGVSAVDAERVAWVLGKEAVDLDREGQESTEPASESAHDVGDGAVKQKDTLPIKTPTPRKRKAEETGDLANGLRRSSRKR